MTVFVGVQNILGGAIGGATYPKDIWYGGAKYTRIFVTGVPKKGVSEILGHRDYVKNTYHVHIIL